MGMVQGMMHLMMTEIQAVMVPYGEDDPGYDAPHDHMGPGYDGTLYLTVMMILAVMAPHDDRAPGYGGTL